MAADPADRRSNGYRAAETAARHAYGRLLASLARASGDISVAEDALAEAFARALTRWPDTGVPDAPEAWLLTAARRRLIDLGRREGVRQAAMGELITLFDRAPDSGQTAFGDQRLALMFACAHPAIDRDLHTALILQTVLGLDAARIAAAFMVNPATMGQRLSRAKRKIRDAGIPFELPGASVIDERLETVLDAVYAAYGTGWETEHGPAGHADLTLEAIYLARLVCELSPGSGEARGLLAQMLYCEARRAARRDTQGRFVPLSDQDTTLWDVQLIDEAEILLSSALTLGPPGRFVLQAAIQSVHAERRVRPAVNWVAAAKLYDALIAVDDGLGGRIARASAHGEAFGPEAALDLLDALNDVDAARLARHQPFWASRAHWLARAGHGEAARDAYVRALDLTRDPALRRHLEAACAAL